MVELALNYLFLIREHSPLRESRVNLLPPCLRDHGPKSILEKVSMTSLVEVVRTVLFPC